MQKIITTTLLICIFNFSLITKAQQAKETDTEAVLLEDLKALDYPELQVVPRASERLAIESIAIKDKGILMLFPYVASSVSTLATGVLVGSNLRSDISVKDRDDAEVNARLATGLGLGGLGLAFWYTYSDSYGAVSAQIRGLKSKDRRTELLKERLAEEAFEKSAQQISQWKWVFVGLNLVANAQLTGKSKADNNAAPTLGMAAALLPLFISTSYETNYYKQLEYKRRIYVPLTWFDYQFNPLQAQWQPTMNAVWTF